MSSRFSQLPRCGDYSSERSLPLRLVVGLNKTVSAVGSLSVTLQPPPCGVHQDGSSLGEELPARQGVAWKADESPKRNCLTLAALALRNPRCHLPLSLKPPYNGGLRDFCLNREMAAVKKSDLHRQSSKPALLVQWS